MIDWAAGLEERNYAVRRVTDLPNLNDLLRIILPIVVLAGFSYFYLWSRIQILDIGYEAQRLQVQEDELRKTETNLIIEEESLKLPERIDRVARNELGLTPLHPYQILAPPLHEVELGRPTDLALAAPPASVRRPAKLSDAY